MSKYIKLSGSEYFVEAADNPSSEVNTLEFESMAGDWFQLNEDDIRTIAELHNEMFPNFEL